MTIDEAIKHCEEKAKDLSNKAYEEWGKSMSEEEAYNCNECAREHAQLAEWLKELKALKERPQGEWIMHFIEICPSESTEECPFCHAEQTLCGNDDKFCPSCGARLASHIF